MKSEEEIIAEYKKIKHDVDVYHTAKGIPIDRHGNEIGDYDYVNKRVNGS